MKMNIETVKDDVNTEEWLHVAHIPSMVEDDFNEF